MFRRKEVTSNSATASPPKNIKDLPPDLILRILNHLPVTDIPSIACCSRRFKILIYNGEIYTSKLAKLGIIWGENGIMSSAGDLTAESTPSSTLTAEETTLADMVATRLKLMPGGHLLPASGKYLETGTFGGGETGEEVEAQAEVAPTASDKNQPLSITMTVPTQQDNLLDDSNSSQSRPKIQGTLGKLIIGSGGIRAAKASPRKRTVSAVPSRFKQTGRANAREAFKHIYSQLLPYYVDFRKRQKDSKLFGDFDDYAEIGALLNKLRLFSRAGFILDCEELNFALETTIEWFESILLGQFEKAYDSNDLAEMEKNARAAYFLNGGQALVNLFIAKNHIFFDTTFNPSLVSSKLPARIGPSVGYLLSDEFARFMEHTLVNCQSQIKIVSTVFVPEQNAMTLFVAKIFEECVAEYLIAVINAARTKENLSVYLHTLATSVYSCTQFLNYVSNNECGLIVEVELVRKALSYIFRQWCKNYIDEEVTDMRDKFDKEIVKFKRKSSLSKKKDTATPDYLANQEKAQAHKKFVLNVMKAIVFAPIALVSFTLMRADSQSLLDNPDPASPVDRKKQQDADSYNLDGDSLNSLLSLELCINLMHINKESLGRALIITHTTEPSKLWRNVEIVFCTLLDVLGEKHIKPAFGTAIERLDNSTLGNFSPQDENTPVNLESLQFFEMVHIADLIQQMVDVYYNEDVKPWIDESDFLSDIVVQKKSFERILDDSVAQGMDKSIQVLIETVEKILMNELIPTDYCPQKPLNDIRPTKACKMVIKTLNAHTKLLAGATEKQTLEVFFGEVGVRLFNAIVKSIKKLQVNQEGAMQLLCDMNNYYEWSSSLRVSQVNKLFSALKEIGYLYLAADGEELKQMVHEQPRLQGAFRIEEIYELVSCRTDYKKIQKYVENKECSLM